MQIILACIEKHLFLSLLQCFWSFLFVLMTWYPKRSIPCWFVLICVFSRNHLSLEKRWLGGGNPTPLKRSLGRHNHRICDSCPIYMRRADILGQVSNIKGLSKTCFWRLWISLCWIESEVVNSVDQAFSPFLHYSYQVKCCLNQLKSLLFPSAKVRPVTFVCFNEPAANAE